MAPTGPSWGRRGIRTEAHGLRVKALPQEEAEKLAAKMARGTFDLNDFANQLRQITKMGSISNIIGMLGP